MARSNHEICDYHQELADNQEEIKLSQVRIETHLEGMRGTARAIKWIAGGCCTFLGIIAVGVWAYGWSLGMAAQANRGNIERLMAQVIELKQSDKEICERITNIQRDHDRMAGAKANGKAE